MYVYMSSRVCFHEYRSLGVKGFVLGNIFVLNRTHSHLSKYECMSEELEMIIGSERSSITTPFVMVTAVDGLVVVVEEVYTR